MGTSRRVVWKAAFAPPNPARSNLADPYDSASVPKCDLFPHPSRWVSAPGSSKPMAALVCAQFCHLHFRLRQSVEISVERARIRRSSRKLSGFPTVAPRTPIDHSQPEQAARHGIRRRKVFFHPRPREGIPQDAVLDFRKHFRLARM